MKTVKAFAPASIGNIGPGFDVLGMAITEIGDTVIAQKSTKREVTILEVTGSDGTIPLDATRNTAGIAAIEVLKRLKAKHGVELKIRKGIPGTGLGSSAASAVAAAVAVSGLFGGKLKKEQLLEPCAIAEESVSGGAFIDNVGASLYGGIVVTFAPEKRVTPVGVIPDLVVVVVTPEHRILTKIARAVLTDKVTLDQTIANMARTATMVAAVGQKNARLFAESIQDVIVEPLRAHLIPGFTDAKSAALKAGALGCSISGAGSSIFALTDKRGHAKRIGLAIQKVFSQHGVSSVITVAKTDKKGARLIR